MTYKSGDGLVSNICCAHADVIALDIQKCITIQPFAIGWRLFSRQVHLGSPWRSLRHHRRCFSGGSRSLDAKTDQEH